MNNYFRGMTIVLLAASLGTPALAHHSFSAQYDSEKAVNLTGTVTKIEWQNPHVYIYVDVQNDKSEYEQWALEMGSPHLS